MTQPLDLDAIQARFEASTHPDWRDTTDVGRLIAEVRRLTAELDQARASAFREAARLLENTGRDDDAVNLLDIVADGITANSPAAAPTA